MIDREKLYDLMYEKADKLIKQHNPCNIHKKGRRIICNNKYMCETRGNSLCCANCKYLSKQGCTIKCLGCKVGMCWIGNSIHYTFNDGYANLGHTKIDKQFIIKMERLRNIAKRYNLNEARISKEDIFNSYLIEVQ